MKTLILYSIVILTIFAPGKYLGLGIPAFHVEDVLILLGMFAILFGGRKSVGHFLVPPHLRKLTIPYAITLTYVLLVTLLFVPLYPSYMRASSVTSAVGRFKPLMLLLVVFAMLSDRRRVQRLGALLVLVIFVEFFLMVCQRENYFGVNAWLNPMYKLSPLHPIGIYGRVFGSFGNPNNLGTAISLLGTAAYAMMIYGHNRTFRLAAAVGVALALVSCVWLARSRQGTGCLLAGCFIVQMIAVLKSGRRGWGSIIAVVAIIGLIIAVVYLEADPELAHRFGLFTGRHGLTAEASLMFRLSLWGGFIDTYGGSIIFGKGMAGMMEAEVVWDSGYLTTLAFGGVPALVGLFFIMFAPPIAAWRRVKTIGFQHPDAWLHVTCVASAAPLFLANIINNTITNSRVMTVVVLVYGLSFAAMKIEDAEWEEYSLAGGEYWPEQQAAPIQPVWTRGPAV